MIILIVVGCSYRIKITMTRENGNIAFHFVYPDKPSRPVKLFMIGIRESLTGKIIWGMIAAEPSQFFETRDSQVFPKGAKEIPSKAVNVIQISDLTFGNVPNGFKQYYPLDNASPVLASDIKYTIYVDGGQGSGLLTFTVSNNNVISPDDSSSVSPSK